MKLYYAPRTRGTRPRWLLEELGEPYDLLRLDLTKGEHRSAAYKKIHPHGAVPALVDGDLHLHESSAICMYLADKFPERGLAPPVGSHDRGRYYQWMVYSVATLEPPVVAYYAATEGDATRSTEASVAAEARFDEAAGVIEAALGDQPWMLGERFSAADVMIASVVGWAAMAGLVKKHEKLAAYLERARKRPPFARARAD